MADIKEPPMIRPGETDDEYEARLQAAGFTDADVQAWFESEFPISDSDFSHSTFDDDDGDEDNAQGDEGADEFSRK
jgi:hypothetical protein